VIDTRKISEILQKSDFVMACYLLGSAAREELRFDSDIDLALLFQGGVTPDHGQIRALSLQLSEALGRMVDIGVLSSRNLVYAQQAVFTGKRIFERDKDRVDLMVSALMGLYGNLQFERAEVINAYTA